MKNTIHHILFCGEQIIVRQDNTDIQFILSDAEIDILPIRCTRRYLIDDYQEKPCYAWQVQLIQDLPTFFIKKNLRALLPHLSTETLKIVGKAFQTIKWDQDHQFCGRCGAPTQLLRGEERAKQCPQCQLTHYPRISPAIIVAVRRDDQLLLSRAPHFPPQRYSVQAGFVEIGESLEETVHRELWEEVGITVTHVRYVTSQAWAFPHSLMIGFTADYLSGELRLDPKEVADARWFKRDEPLPELPPPVSIARRLIEDFLRG